MADHESGVDKLAKTKLFHDIEGHAKEAGRRHLPINKQCQPIEKQAGKVEFDLVAPKKRLKTLKSREMATRVIAEVKGCMSGLKQVDTRAAIR